MGSPWSKGTERNQVEPLESGIFECARSILAVRSLHSLAPQLLAVKADGSSGERLGAESPLADTGPGASPEHAQLAPMSALLQRSCRWLDAADTSLIERTRRLAVLHRVCNAILAASPDRRPCSLPAFGNFTKRVRRVRTYTVDPKDMIECLDEVSAEVRQMICSQPRPCIIPEAMMETPPAKATNQAARCWNQLRKQETFASSGAQEQLRWIQSRAFVECIYSSDEVVQALSDLHLLPWDGASPCKDQYGRAMSEAACRISLTVPEFFPEAPWSTYRPKLHNVLRRVQLPVGCAGAFFGNGGASLRSLSCSFKLHAQRCAVLSPPSVRISVKTYSLYGGRSSVGMVELKVAWCRWERKGAALEAADKVFKVANELEHVLRQHIGAIHAARLNKLAERREKRAERRQEWGRAYHEQRRMERMEKLLHSNDSALRGLQLPPAGISQRFGAPRYNRKDVAQQRRRASLREKRKCLLRACDELGLLEAPSLQKRGHPNMPAPSGTGAAGRLLKHLCSCQEEVAQQALDNLNVCRDEATRMHQPKQRQQRRCRQQRRMDAMDWQ